MSKDGGGVVRRETMVCLVSPLKHKRCAAECLTLPILCARPALTLSPAFRLHLHDLYLFKEGACCLTCKA